MYNDIPTCTRLIFNLNEVKKWLSKFNCIDPYEDQL